jgi:hypothetical protein
MLAEGCRGPIYRARQPSASTAHHSDAYLFRPGGVQIVAARMNNKVGTVFIASAVGVQSPWRPLPPVHEGASACSSARRTR